MRAKLRAALPYVAVAAIAIGFVNFFWFIAESAALGGDAVNGYQLDGRSYVGSHGSYTEVARSIWEWSRLHAISVWFTHPLALLGMAYLIFGYGFPLVMGGSSSADVAARASLVRRSGPALASTNCAGAIGNVQFSGRLLRVAVHPSGILIKPTFMRQGVILGAEISTMRFERRFLRKILEVEHSGVDSTPPLRLYVAEGSPVATAIAGLRDRTAGGQPPAPTGVISGPPRPGAIETIMRARGVAVGLAMIAIGVLWLIPQIGAFGLVWTAVAASITAVNLRSWVIASRK